MNQLLFASVDRYISELFGDEDDCLKSIEQSITDNDIPAISIAPTQGKLLHILAKLCRAKRILELGTLAGYSTVWMARALPEDGKLITVEYDPKHAAVASRNFIQCGVDGKIELRTGKAMDILSEMVLQQEPPFDMIFIDADKPPYKEYFESALKLSKPGTLIIADNVIREGAVMDRDSTDERVVGVRRLNDYLAQCKEVTATIFQTVGTKEHDGMAIALVN